MQAMTNNCQPLCAPFADSSRGSLWQQLNPLKCCCLMQVSRLRSLPRIANRVLVLHSTINYSTHDALVPHVSKSAGFDSTANTTKSPTGTFDSLTGHAVGVPRGTRGSLAEFRVETVHTGLGVPWRSGDRGTTLEL